MRQNPIQQRPENSKKWWMIICQCQTNKPGTLKKNFYNGRKTIPSYSPVIAVSPILKEIEPLSKNLSEIAKNRSAHPGICETTKTGAEKPSIIKEWQSGIEKAKQPYAQAEIVIVSAIEKLMYKLK